MVGKGDPNLNKKRRGANLNKKRQKGLPTRRPRKSTKKAPQKQVEDHPAVTADEALDLLSAHEAVAAEGITSRQSSNGAAAEVDLFSQHNDSTNSHGESRADDLATSDNSQGDSSSRKQRRAAKTHVSYANDDDNGSASDSESHSDYDNMPLMGGEKELALAEDEEEELLKGRREQIQAVASTAMRRHAIAYHYLMILDAPPKEKWAGRGGTISVIAAQLNIPIGSSGLVKNVLLDVEEALNTGVEYDATVDKSNVGRPSSIQAGSIEMQIIVDGRKAGLPFDALTVLVNEHRSVNGKEPVGRSAVYGASLSLISSS
jgi:hypothetical protein